MRIMSDNNTLGKTLKTLTLGKIFSGPFLPFLLATAWGAIAGASLGLLVGSNKDRANIDDGNYNTHYSTTYTGAGAVIGSLAPALFITAIFLCAHLCLNSSDKERTPLVTGNKGKPSDSPPKPSAPTDSPPAEADYSQPLLINNISLPRRHQPLLLVRSLISNRVLI